MEVFLISSPPEPRTRIKICGLTREQDVDAAVAAGADAIGLVLYAKSPRFVTPVLLFVNAPVEDVRAACELLPHALLQFHGDETPAWCAEAAGPGRPWLRAARIPADEASPFDLVEFASDYSQAHALLLDAHVEGYGGAGRTFPWSRLPPNVS